MLTSEIYLIAATNHLVEIHIQSRTSTNHHSLTDLHQQNALTCVGFVTAGEGASPSLDSSSSSSSAWQIVTGLKGGPERSVQKTSAKCEEGIETVYIQRKLYYHQRTTKGLNTESLSLKS